MSTTFSSFSRDARFGDLCRSAQNCSLCSRLCSRRKVLGQENGSIESKVLFVAEAPGRLGADRTGVPLHGDRTGDNFEALLANVGWRRDEVFITNAVLCNPRDDSGVNATPTATEIRNCALYLQMTIELIEPDVIVPLGVKALEGLNFIHPHGVTLKGDVATARPWYGRTLFPLYHPGPRALIHRALAKQRSDFMLLAKMVNPQSGLIHRRLSARPQEAASETQIDPSKLQQVIAAIVQVGGAMTYFRLTKLLYLAEYRHISLHRAGLTEQIFIRQPDGPWLPTLQGALDQMKGWEVELLPAKRAPMVHAGARPRFEVQLADEEFATVADVVDKYSGMTDSQVKSAVYMTDPMRHILREEKTGRDMRRKPVIYKGVVRFD